MSNGLLFGIGVVITVLVSIGVGLPVYGAILDGRDQAAGERAELRRLSEKQADRRSAA